jgi:hypothetical protein
MTYRQRVGIVCSLRVLPEEQSILLYAVKVFPHQNISQYISYKSIIF